MKVPEEYKSMVGYSKAFLKKHPETEIEYYLCLVPEDRTTDYGFGKIGHKPYWGIFDEHQNGYVVAEARIPIVDKKCEKCETVLGYGS